MPSTSPIAQPVRQCRVAQTAVLQEESMVAWTIPLGVCRSRPFLRSRRLGGLKRAFAPTRRGRGGSGHLCNSLHRGVICGRVRHGPRARDPGVAVASDPAVRARPDPPLRPLDRVLLERHPPADLPRAGPHGGRRLGAPATGRAAGRPDKKVYDVAAGRPRASWRAGSPPPPRSSSSAARSRSSSAPRRTATGRPCSPRSATHRAEHATRLAHYEQLASRDYPEPGRARRATTSTSTSCCAAASASSSSGWTG